ncbi:MAG: BamA/TamA family outer membrane protein [Acidobacteriota bacterium]|nr:BamA/TamA family outer membrane protein [Acidobacteriota bacterium]
MGGVVDSGKTGLKETPVWARQSRSSSPLTASAFYPPLRACLQVALFWILICLLGVGLCFCADGPPKLWGKTVRRIELNTDSQLSLALFSAQVVQKPGEPLDREKVSQTLKNMYTTGRFRTLRAGARVVQGGVDLILSGEAQYFVGTVTVRETSKALPESVLASSSRLKLGQPLLPGDLDRAASHVQSTLASNSYYRAKVRYAVARQPANELADILFTVNPGQPARLGEITFTGEMPYPAARLQSIAGWRRGARLSPAKLQRGIFQIHKFLAAKGYLEAASSASRKFIPKDNTVNLTIKVDAGPIVVVRVEGARISKAQLQKALPVIFQEGLTDDLSLDAGSTDLKNFWGRQGYFSAKATWRRIRRASQIDITYAVDPGSQADFTGFDFKGNRSISADTLSAMVTIQPGGFLSHPHGIFSRQMLEQDAKTLTDFYRARGFLEASVVPEIHRSAGQLSATFDVHEGPVTRVGGLTFEGIDEGTIAKLKASMNGLPGKPYSPHILNNDRDAILSYYASQGYPQARIAPHVSAPLDHEVNIDYVIQPGDRVWVGRVVILGNQKTRTSTIRRQITLHAGDPLSQTGIYASQRKLYDVGLFDSVEIGPVNPGSTEDKKTLLVSVKEADRWTLGYGFGLDVQRFGGNQPAGQLRASPRLSLEATRINVGGRNQTLSLRGRLSDLETGGEANYLIPDFLNHPKLSLHVDLLADQTRDVLTFTSMLRQASLTLEKQLSPSTYLLERYNYRLVSVSSLRINPEEIPLVSQPVRDAGFESTFIHDTRDNPADASRGSYSLLDASVSASKLGSEANFVRFLGQSSTYHRFGSHFVFARNTQIGVESAYGGLRQVPAPGQTFLTNQIPLAERFFAGGSDSLRAFSLNQAGPRDPVTGYPVGGEALFLNSLELRMPFRHGRYGLVVFDDAGNVYSGVQEMRLLKFIQGPATDLNYTVDALGAGFRYKTPIGPIRLDLAYGLNTPRYLIAPPGQPVQSLRLPRFQYFISIGQSF